MDDLEPCPFCGGKPKIEVRGGGDERTGYNRTAYVKCTACPGQVVCDDDRGKNGWSKGRCEEKAIAAWNTRLSHTKGDE